MRRLAPRIGQKARGKRKETSVYEAESTGAAEAGAEATLVAPLATEPPAPAKWRGWLAGALRRAMFAVAGLLLFVIALELLKKGAGGYGRQLIGLLDVSTPASA